MGETKGRETKGCGVCVFEIENMKEKKRGTEEGNENNRPKKKREGGGSFPECFLPRRMTFLLNFFRSKGAHGEPRLERLAWFRNIVG